MIKLLFLGDIVGKSGREAVIKALPDLRKLYSPDCIVVNAENAAHGFGITKTISDDLFDMGVHVITTGNHIWDKAEIMLVLAQQNNILRPHNYPKHLPGSGVCEFETHKGHKIVVINLMGRLFMESMDDPFSAVDEILKNYTLGRNAHAIFLDFHAETTSEKQAMCHHLDGRVSAVIGSHTHVPTADQRVFPKGTAYMSDAGMCGDYFDTVIGMSSEASLARFLKKVPYERMQPGTGEGTVCGALVDIGGDGLAKSIIPVRAGREL